MKLRKTAMALVSAAIALTAATGLAGCGNDSGSTGGTASTGGTDTTAAGEASSAPAVEVSDTLTVYTAMSEDELPAYTTAFKEATGITLETVRLSAGEMVTRITAEKENPQAAVAWGGATDSYITLENAGLLDQYTSPEAANFPSQFLDPNGYWSPIYVGAIAFACNQEWFAEHPDVAEPTSWADLTKAEFKGEIAMAHPSTSGTAYTVLATIFQLMGGQDINSTASWDYMKALNANVTQYSKSGSAPVQAAAMGEVAVGVSFAHDILKVIAQGYKLDMTFPSDGTGTEVGAIALIHGGPADELTAAQKFIDFVLSKEGQDLYAENNTYRDPVNPEAEVGEGVVTLDKLKVIDYDAKWAGDNKTTLIEMFQEMVDDGSNVSS
ncbi:MAG: ABC transporter substrate-binding protein [Propionibacteriaceae bacterium]|jgi:iron(III) transport system substrate-binding protein|nr:ABC transporter substrate-binding protein [Propionibacteriaceae bacterium]